MYCKYLFFWHNASYVQAALRFVSISDSLPKTSSVKMVKLWMLFSLMQPFVDVLLQTYINILNGQITKIEKRMPVQQGEKPAFAW